MLFKFQLDQVLFCGQSSKKHVSWPSCHKSRPRYLQEGPLAQDNSTLCRMSARVVKRRFTSWSFMAMHHLTNTVVHLNEGSLPGNSGFRNCLHGSSSLCKSAWFHWEESYLVLLGSTSVHNGQWPQRTLCPIEWILELLCWMVLLA